MQQGKDEEPVWGSPYTNNPGADTLRRLYAEEGLPVKEIAAKYFVEENTVRHWLSAAKIRRPADKREYWRINPGEDALRQACLEEGRTDKEIAHEYGVDERTVRRWRSLAGIKRPRHKSPEKLPREDLEHAYLQEGLTAAQAAKEFGVTEAAVRRWLADYGIRKNPGGGADAG